MWILRISFELTGEHFSPRALLPELPFPHVVFASHEAEERTFPDAPTTYGLGSLCLLAPGKVAVAPVAGYEQWYLDVVATYSPLFQQHGVTEMNLFHEIFYTKQCNFEVFSRQGLAILAQHQVAVPISVYKLSKPRLMELLRDAGWTRTQVKQYVAAEG